jgi:proteasome lid subunit RPN8/RPN11
MLKIEKSVIEHIKSAALNELPNEACGYLAGKKGIITQCYELTNIDYSPEHFSFDPAEQFNTLKEARSLDLEIIANFHSHPETPARPSVEDIRLAFDPNIIYGIISLAEPNEVLKFFSIIKGEVKPIEFTII